jgi:hypothetical protein
VRSVGFFSRAVRRGRRGGSGGGGQIHMAKRRRHIHTSEKSRIRFVSYFHSFLVVEKSVIYGGRKNPYVLLLAFFATAGRASMHVWPGDSR